MMENNIKKLLINGISQIDEELADSSVIGLLEKYYDNITLFNPSLKLVGSSGEELIIKHFLDCFAPYPILKREINGLRPSFADLGSGNGMPGLVLSCVFPQVEFTLVERMERRAGFLRNTIALLGLNDRVNVLVSDLKDVDKQFDYIAFRAFRPMTDIAKDLKRISGNKTEIFIYKSDEENIKSEIDAAETLIPGTFYSKVENYTVPFLEAKRSLLIFKHR